MRSWFDAGQPLWLPPGSVRSIVALIVLVGFCAGWVPLELVTLVVGFYFGHRASQDAKIVSLPPTGLALLLALLIAPAGSAAEYWQWTEAAPHQHVAVKVRAGNAGGTGGLIFKSDDGRRGLVLTAHHVIEGNRQATAVWLSGERSSGRILGADPANDLAVFEVDPPDDAPVVEIAASDPPPGAALELLGYGGPTGRLRHFAATAEAGAPDENTLQARANLLNGDSGGLVLYEGELCGILRGGPHSVDVGIVSDGGNRWPLVFPAWGSRTYPIRRLIAHVWQPWAGHLGGQASSCPGGYCRPPQRYSSPTAPPTAPPAAPPIKPDPPAPACDCPPVEQIVQQVLEALEQRPGPSIDYDAVTAQVLAEMADDERFKPPSVSIDYDAISSQVLQAMADDERFKPIPPPTTAELIDQLPPLHFRLTRPDGTEATATARLGRTVVLDFRLENRPQSLQGQNHAEP